MSMIHSMESLTLFVVSPFMYSWLLGYLLDHFHLNQTFAFWFMVKTFYLTFMDLLISHLFMKYTRLLARSISQVHYLYHHLYLFPFAKTSMAFWLLLSFMVHYWQLVYHLFGWFVNECLKKAGSSSKQASDCLNLSHQNCRHSIYIYFCQVPWMLIFEITSRISSFEQVLVQHLATHQPFLVALQVATQSPLVLKLGLHQYWLDFDQQSQDLTTSIW